MIALGDRLLIVKPGFHAGTTFGSLVTTFFYRDVTAIQVQTFLVSGWIEVSSAGFQGGGRKYNRHPRPSDRDVYKLANCIPIHKWRLTEYQPALTRLRECVRSAKVLPTAQAAPAALDLAEKLVRLSELCDAGSITRREFEQAKQHLLDPG